jgi:hypothetical protein
VAAVGLGCGEGSTEPRVVPLSELPTGAGRAAPAAGVTWNATSAWLDIYDVEVGATGPTLTVPLYLNPPDRRGAATSSDRHAILNNTGHLDHYNAQPLDHFGELRRTDREFGVACGGTLLTNAELLARVLAVPPAYELAACGSDWGNATVSLPNDIRGCYYTPSKPVLDELGDACVAVEIIR